MKNIFKSLMLVAVAAMAFTACEKDNNETAQTEQKTVINGVATIANDDTRSGFTGSTTENDKTYYQSAWDGTETIKLFIDGIDPVTTTIDANGRFSVEVEGNISSGTSMTICSPAEAWNSAWSPTIPTEQTPRANSVDPAVHILQSQGATVGGGDISMSLQQACYGKMTLDVPEGFVTDKVVIELNGLVYFSEKGNRTLTLNADHVQNNVFWFAVDATIDVDNFVVTAYDANDNTCTKTVTIPEGRELKFYWGKVSAFSVDLTQSADDDSNEGGDASTTENIVFKLSEVSGWPCSSSPGVYGDVRLTDVNGRNFIQIEVNEAPLRTYTYVYDNTINYPAGTYFAPNTVVNYAGNPNESASNIVVTSGTFDVVVDGDNWILTIDFVLADGNKFTGTYNGPKGF